MGKKRARAARLLCLALLLSLLTACGPHKVEGTYTAASIGASLAFDKGSFTLTLPQTLLQLQSQGNATVTGSYSQSGTALTLTFDQQAVAELYRPLVLSQLREQGVDEPDEALAAQSLALYLQDSTLAKQQQLVYNQEKDTFEFYGGLFTK